MHLKTEGSAISERTLSNSRDRWIAKAQLAVIEFFEIAVGAAGFVAGHAADAAVDGLPFEAGVGVLDFGDEVAAGELCGAGAVMEAFDGVEAGGSAAWAGISKLGLKRRDRESRPVDGVVAVRIV